MNIAILGGTGFVGKNICKYFDRKGISYSIASRSNGTDLRKLDNCIAFFQKTKPDFIINCAAHVGSLNYVTKQAADVIIDNSYMIMAMYQAIKETSLEAVVINPIANCAYPGNAEIFTENEWWNGHLHRSVLSYGSTRRFLWGVSECFNMQHNIKSISLLVPNMYGPYDSTDPNKAHALNALISKFVKAEKNREEVINIWGTGIAIREWLYAEDFAKIVYEIINNPKMPGLAEPVNIAQNFGLSVKEIIEIINASFKFSGKIEYDCTKPDGAPKKVMDDRKFKKLFPDFNFISLDEGIKNTINYYESVYPY